MKKTIAFMLTVCMISTLFLGAVPVFAAAPLSVGKPMVEYMEDPIGLGRQDIQFSWQISKGDTRGVKQESYQIKVAESAEKLGGADLMWDSTVVASDKANGITYAGLPLLSGKQYFWQVTVKDNLGGSAVSAVSAFSMGLLNEGAWNGAKWISDTGGNYGVGDSKVADPKIYTVEATFTITRDNFGLVFGASNSNNFYMWQINTKEGGVTADHVWFRPHKWVNGGAAGMGEFDISGILPLDDAIGVEHTIRIEADHGKFTTYIDDQLVTYDKPARTTPARSVDYLEDGSHPNIGDVGFRSCSDANVKEEFEVTEIKVLNSLGVPAMWDNFAGRNIFTSGEVADGKFFIVHGGTGELRALQKAADDKIYTFETDLKVGYQAAGPVFAASGTSSFYMWQLNTFDFGKTYLRPHKWPSPATLGQIDINDVLPKERAENEFNNMRVDFDNNLIKTYINGTLVDSRTATNHPTIGNIGFRQSKDGSSVNPEVGQFKTMALRDAGGRYIIYDNFEESGENYYDGTTLADGVLTVTNSPKEVYLRGTAPAAPTDKSIPYMRKDFTSTGSAVKRAVVYASALGHYELQLNGEKVGEDFMAPGWTEYAKRVQYQAYDVTSGIRAGEVNTLGALLAPGWYSGNISILGNKIYGSDQALIVNLVIEYADGTTQTVVSDGSWQYMTDGAIRSTDMFDGEAYDANKEIGGGKYGFSDPAVAVEGWGSVGVAFENAYGVKTGASGGQAIALTAQIGPGVKKMQTLHPVSIQEVAGKYIVDMGQNFAGILEMSLKGTAGATAKIRYGEMLNDNSGTGDGAEGTLYTANLRSAKATDTYTFKSNGKETWEPNFTFHGFRYAEISGCEKPELGDITGYALYSGMDETGEFETSDSLLNQIYSNVVWGQRSNFLCIPTDCPQRDERMGWGADTLVFAKTGIYNMNAAMFYQKWLLDMRDGQYSDGDYGNTAPNPHNFKGDIVWAGSGVTVPYDLWRQTGDTRVIADNYAAMQRWMVRKSSSLFHSCGYGDWLEPTDGASNKEIIGTTYYAYELSMMAEMADALGKTSDADAYRARFEQVKEAYASRYIKADGTIDSGLQSYYILTLGVGLASENNEAALVEKLVEAIEKNNGLMSVGFVSVNLLMPMLSKYGYADIAYSLAMEKRYPSWGYSIEQGATTIWERWNSYTKENGFGPVSMNSFNHYSFGSVVQWFYSGILGIDNDPAAPGYANVIVEPVFDGRLSYAKGSYNSIRGKIDTRWDFAGNQMKFVVTVPANATATVILPGAASAIKEGTKALSTSLDGVTAVDSTNGKTTVSVGSGTYTFSFAYTAMVKVNKSALRAAIANAQAKLAVKEDYTVTTYRALETALKAAQLVLDNADAVQAQVDAAALALINAIGALLPGDLANLALGSAVTASSQVSATTFAAYHLVDGIRAGTGETTWSSSLTINTNHIEWIRIDLGAAKEFNTFLVFPRNDGAPSGYGFPKDFVIEVSGDGTNWTKIVDETSYPYTGTTPQRFAFDAVTARYVRMTGTGLNPNPGDNNTYRMQLAEFEIYNVPGIPVQNIKINSVATTMVRKNKTLQLTATLTPAYADVGTEVTWSSSNQAAVAVNAQTGLVTGIKAGGSSRVTATTSNGKTYTITVTVDS